MISPEQVDRLQDQLDRFIAVLICGCLIFLVGGTMGVFASQEFGTGTDFMLRFAGGEQVIGLLLIVVGWVKIRLLHAELQRHAPSNLSEQTWAARAGH
jgi:hypothetical protein